MTELDYEAFELRRAVPGPPVRRTGLRVTSVELYADCTIVRWHVDLDEARGQMPGGESPALEFDLRGELEDDVETSYERVRGLYDLQRPLPHAEAVRGYTVFKPTTPDQARRVAFRILSERFDIDLGEPH